MVLCLAISTKLILVSKYDEIGNIDTMLQPDQIDVLYGIKEIIFYKNGLEVKRSARYPMARAKPTARKGVFDMSKKSKLRLTHIVANSQVKFNSMFTCTYGDFFIPHDGRELKRQCNLLLTNFRKRFDNEYIWFMEFTTKQKRPHLHVITTVVPNEWDRHWLGQRWSAISVKGYFKRMSEGKYKDIYFKKPIDTWIVESESQKVKHVHEHIENWEMIRKVDGATRYCLKYAAKEEQKLVPPSFHNVGRFWGTSQGVTPKPIGRLIIGETMTEAAVREVLSETFVGNFPLIPKFIFQQDAREFFASRGLLLTEFIEENFNEEGDEIGLSVL